MDEMNNNIKQKHLSITSDYSSLQMINTVLGQNEDVKAEGSCVAIYFWI